MQSPLIRLQQFIHKSSRLAMYRYLIVIGIEDEMELRVADSYERMPGIV